MQSRSVEKPNDHLLFGSRRTTVNLSALHPEPVQIFRLWQIYLDNVNPLLKVTHTPSLQGRIIEAASNVKGINPTLEAVMFSIYCTSILSLMVEDCQTIFGSSKEDLLMRYQFGCQQALLNCGVLQSNDRDCLTALYLYLVGLVSANVISSLLTIVALCPTQNKPSISVLHARRRDPHCATHGYTQRVGIGTMHPLGGRNAPEVVVVARSL